MQDERARAAEPFTARYPFMSTAVSQDSFEADRLLAQIAVAKVLTLEGETARIRDFWRGGTTVTSFVRHFGCLFCHQMVHDLVTHVPEIIERGASVVIVGNGSVEQAKRFFAMKQLPRGGVTVLTDPERETYKAAGLERGYGRTFLHPKALGAAGTARKEGHRITGLFGDLTQLGGLLVVRPPASLVYFHKSRFAGDHPSMTEVVGMLSGG